MFEIFVPFFIHVVYYRVKTMPTCMSERIKVGNATLSRIEVGKVGGVMSSRIKVGMVANVMLSIIKVGKVGNVWF